MGIIDLRILFGNYLYWFHWLESGKDLGFDKRVEQMFIAKKN